MSHKESLTKKIIRGFAEYGLKGNEAPSFVREHMLVNFFTLIVMSMCSTMFAYSYVRENYYMSSVVAFLMIGWLVVFMVHLGVRNRLFTAISFSLVILSVSFGMLWLDKEGVGLYHWLYLMPLLLVYMGGLKRGSIVSLLLFAMLSTLLLHPHFLGMFYYVPTLRFLLSLASVTLISIIVEFSREQLGEEWGNLMKRLSVDPHTDQLTGLFNREEIEIHLAGAMATSNEEGTSFSLLLCDIDFFRDINDSFGRDAGDLVLIELSDMFRGMIRGDDFLCRWAGEEFLFILPDTSEKAAYLLAERLRKKMKRHKFVINGAVLHVTGSFGVVTWDFEEDSETLVQLVTKSMQDAKEQGRNLVH